jgi:hypothetical protein
VREKLTAIEIISTQKGETNNGWHSKSILQHGSIRRKFINCWNKLLLTAIFLSSTLSRW